jgi:hypothetical protein
MLTRARYSRLRRVGQPDGPHVAGKSECVVRGSLDRPDNVVAVNFEHGEGGACVAVLRFAERSRS